MKKYILIISIAALFLTALIITSAALAKRQQNPGYILEHEKDIARDEPGPHDGGGPSTVYGFFNKAMNSKLIFRKRVLHTGAAIGYHLQKEEEIYYVVSGTGEMTINNKVFRVNAGDSILTLPGSSHGLKQTGTEDLVLIINYEKQPPK